MKRLLDFMRDETGGFGIGFDLGKRGGGGGGGGGGGTADFAAADFAAADFSTT